MASESVRDELCTPIHVDAGFYSRGLSRYFSHFGEDHVLILMFEEFVAAPRRALRQAFRFLGVDEGFAEQVQLGTHNAYRRRISIARRQGRAKRFWVELHRGHGSRGDPDKDLEIG